MAKHGYHDHGGLGLDGSGIQRPIDGHKLANEVRDRESSIGLGYEPKGKGKAHVNGHSIFVIYHRNFSIGLIARPDYPAPVIFICGIVSSESDADLDLSLESDLLAFLELLQHCHLDAEPTATVIYS
jgi:hypothetical protein